MKTDPIVEQVRQVRRKIEEENQRLKEEVRRLQHEKEYIEEVARKELGMVKEGEMIYLFDLPTSSTVNSK